MTKLTVSRRHLLDVLGLPPNARVTLWLPVGAPVNGDDTVLVVYLEDEPAPLPKPGDPTP